MDRPLSLVVAFASLAFVAACGSSRGGGGGGGGGGGDPSCDAQSFSSQIATICRAQFPADPAPRTQGASCTSDSQCNSAICIKPFGGFDQYCTRACPRGNECPMGYDCQDSGTRGPLCYRGVCVYGGSDLTDCVTRLSDEAKSSCEYGRDCSAPLSAWLGCIEGAGRLCGTSDAHQACGVERAQLDSCCPLCNSQEL